MMNCWFPGAARVCTVNMRLVDIHQRRLSEFQGGETLLNLTQRNTVCMQHNTRKYKHFKILYYTDTDTDKYVYWTLSTSSRGAAWGRYKKE